MKDFIKNYGILLSIIVLPLLLFIGMIILSSINDDGKRNVHWHMPLSYDLCGDTTQLPENELGHISEVHGHNDGQIHVEDRIDVLNPTKTLGEFFDTSGIDFSETQIAGYNNGDKCEGSETPGKLSVIINGENNTEFRDYILRNGDEVEIIFK